MTDEQIHAGASAYFAIGRCSGHAQFNGRYCRDVAGPDRWCIHCAGYRLLHAYDAQADRIAALERLAAHCDLARIAALEAEVALRGEERDDWRAHALGMERRADAQANRMAALEAGLREARALAGVVRRQDVGANLKSCAAGLEVHLRALLTPEAKEAR